MDCKRQVRLKFFIPLAVVFLLETFLFNFAFWEALTFPEQQQISVSSLNNIVREGNEYRVTDSDTPYIEYAVDGPTEIDNLDIDLVASDSDAVVGGTYSLSPYVLDEGNTNGYISLGTAHVSENLTESHYIRIHPAGKVTGLRLKLNMQEGDKIVIDSVSINAQRPFSFSFLRFLIMLLVSYLVFCFWPSRDMYQWNLDLKVRRQKILLSIFVFIQIMVLLAVTQLIHPAQYFDSIRELNGGAFIGDENQYNYLANAIINGHTYLDLPVPEWMQKMTNPYDASARAQLSFKTGEPTYWDYAFYNGKYYCYFGSLPALSLFVPFKLITGHDLRTDYAVALMTVFFVLAAVFFLYSFMKKYIKPSFGLFLVSLLLLVTGSGVLTQAFYPMIYSLPILFSLVLTLTGLGLWINARKDAGELSKLHLLIGAICIALNLGCRPQFVLVVFVAFPIFWSEIRERFFFSVRGIWNTLAVIVPFLLVGGVTMAYNHVRFDSFFDFGATYNLTGFDMVHRSYALSRIPWGLWMYLFQPINISPNYPFMKQLDVPSGFMGQTIMEPNFGGFFAFVPAALFAFLLCIVRKEAKASGIWGINLFFVGFAAVLLVVDTEIVGISTRYYSEFGWLLIIGAISTVALYVKKYSSERISNLCLNVFVLLTLVGVFLSYLNLLSDGRYGYLSSSNDALYRVIESWFSFLS